MSTPRTVEPINLPIPLGGMDFVSPLSEMDPNYSPWLLNVDAENRSLKVRPAYVRHAEIDPIASGSTAIAALGTFGSNASSNKLFAYVVDTGQTTHFIYEVTGSTPSLSNTLADNELGGALSVNMGSVLYFINPFLDFADCSRYFNGTWQFYTFTYDDGGGADPIGGPVACSYRGRIYLFLDRSMYYGDLEALGGATGLFPLDTIFDSPGSITWASVLSSPGERAAELYLAIGTEAGEILIYTGAHPEDPTWNIVGKYSTSPTLGYNSILNFRNDVWILTQTGITSLRTLIQTGEAANNEESISYRINDYWQKLVANFTDIYATPSRNISAAYWPERNRVFVLMPGHLDKDGIYSGSSATMFSYNVATRAFTIHKLDNVDTSNLTGNLTYFRNNIYFASGNVVMKVDEESFGDEEYDTADEKNPYSYSIESAYSSLGSRLSNKRLQGVEPIFKTDFASASDVTMKAAADMGRQVSSAQSVGLVDGYNIPYYSVGAEGTYLQWRMEGQSDVNSQDGLDLFGVGMMVEPGGTR